MARIRREFVDTPLGQVMVRLGGSGKPVFLLHNTYLGGESWLRNGFLEKMADHYYVVAPDTIGQGDSDLPPHPLDIADYAANLGDVMTALGIEKASFVGSHTGASIAMELAVSQPEKVDKLVFAGLPFWNAEQRATNTKAPRFVPWEAKADGTYLADLWKARLPITHGLTPDQMHWQFLAFLRPGPRVHEPLHALFRYEPRDRLPLVKAPVLALSTEGEQFQNTLPEIQSLLPGIEVQTVEKGTLAHSMDANDLLAKLRKYLG